METIYDLIIIGSGSAGLSAGLYAGRAMLNTLIIEKKQIGGQIINTAEVVNYPGVRKTSGPELMEVMHAQAKDFGVSFVTDEIKKVDFSGEVKRLISDKQEYLCRAVIIATGAQPRKLGFPGEKEYTGRGIAYCATCDGEFFTGLDIFVIGGGYAAAEEAIYLTRFGKHVTMIIREPDFTCAKSIADKVKAHPDITIHYHTEIKKASGDDLLREATFINNQTGEEFTYTASEEDQTFGIFVFAGYEPATALFKDHIDLDDYGYIPTDENMRTNIQGVFAAGDLRPKALRQIVTAVADGAIAATAAEQYVTQEKERLGIKEEKKVPPKSSETTSSAPSKAAAASPQKSENPLWPAELMEQVRGILNALNQDVTLVTIVNPQNEHSLELKNWLEVLPTLNSHIHLNSYEAGSNTAVEEQIGADQLPVVAFLDQNGTYTGVKFYGIPGGHEMNSFILALYNLAGPGQAMDDKTLNRIKAIDKPVKLNVCISLSCKFCPDVVAACQRIAILNPQVEASMMDIALFPHLKKEFKIMSVPAVIKNNDKLLFGSKTIDEILDFIEE